MSKMKKIMSAIKPLVKEVERVPGEMPDSLYQYVAPYKLKTSVGVGAIAGVTAIGAVNEGYKGHVSGKIGKMSSSAGLSHMTDTANEAVSPLISKLQNGQYSAQRIENNLSNHGADGDIVFALHNMR